MVGSVGSSPQGRPRSEAARVAVLHAVDDLLVEQGYAAMTMKGIALRAGVGRQTLYRWWSHKAEILAEACAADAEQDLSGPPRDTALAELTTYAQRLHTFLTEDPAGLGYLALLGEAQHDPAVAGLVQAADMLTPSARVTVDRVRALLPLVPASPLALTQLVGPIVYFAMTNPRGDPDPVRQDHPRALARAWSGTPHG